MWTKYAPYVINTLKGKIGIKETKPHTIRYDEHVAVK